MFLKDPKVVLLWHLFKIPLLKVIGICRSAKKILPWFKANAGA